MSAPAMELRRAQEPAPTVPGWYYASLPGAPNIIPVYLEEYYPGHLAAWDAGIEELIDVDQFNWYGPVPICKESGT